MNLDRAANKSSRNAGGVIQFALLSELKYLKDMQLSKCWMNLISDP